MSDSSLALPQGYELLQVLTRHANRHVLRCRVRDRPGDLTILKCLLPPFDDRALENFRAEFLLLDALVHPNWVRPRRFGALDSGGWYLELEDCPGVSLAQWPLRGWWPENLGITRQLLSGLESLHRLGYAQLDLSPTQVLVDPVPSISRGWAASTEESREGPSVRLLDLGLAERFGKPLAGRGTPGYMAPELLRGRSDWDGRTDLYALGAILFELFTGAPAFPGSSVAEILARQTSGAVPDPGATAGLPPPVRALVRELLDPDPNRRPTSALEIWQRLRDQAPRERGGVLPLLLEPGTAFAFQGRDHEIHRFSEWLSRHEGVHDSRGRRLRCSLIGDEGIGRRRLVRRLGAIAQARGWVLEEETPWPVLRWPARGTCLGVELDLLAVPEPLRHGTAVAVDDGDTCLTLRLGPLSIAEQERILQGQGMEAPALRTAVAAESLGVPGRMETLIARIPREVDLAARYVQESSATEALRDIVPPEDWIRHAGRLLGAFASAERDVIMLLAMMESGCATKELADWAGTSEEAISTVLEPAQRRGFIRFESHRWRLHSTLWARAVTEADEPRRDRVGRRLLQLFSDQGRLLDPVAAFRLALRLGEFAAATTILPGALRQLETAGRLEDALGLWSEAALGGIAPEVLYSEAVAMPLLLEGVLMARRSSRMLPPPQQMPRSAVQTDIERLWHAWAGMTRDSLAAVEETLRNSCKSPTTEFVRLWVRARARLFGADYDGFDRDVELLGSFREDAELPGALWIGLLKAAHYSERLQWKEHTRIYDSVLRQVEQVSAPVHALILANRGHADLQCGRLERACRCLESAQEMTRRHGLRLLNANLQNTLAGVLYQKGDLGGAQRTLEHLVWKWSGMERWGECVLAAANLCVILLEQGQLGAGLRAASDARVLALRAADSVSVSRATARQVYALHACGLLERALDGADRFLVEHVGSDNRYRRMVAVVRAKAAMSLGRSEEARHELRRAVEEFRALGGVEDAKETVLFWALHELDGNEPERAIPLCEEAIGAQVETSALTQSLEALVAGEVAVLRGDGSPGASELLRRAVALMEAQNRWSLAWRAHWKLAESLASLGLPGEAAAEYATARAILVSVAESFRKEAPTGPFLDLPAVRRFLDCLSGN